MGHDHGHSHNHLHGSGPGHERSLIGTLLLTGAFLVAEVAGGLWSHSLALLSDAAHMFTDVTALAISLAAVRIGGRVADERRTFGYYRFEILAALCNAVLLLVAAVFILVEAWRRLHAPPALEPTLMLWIAAAGLVVNLLGMRLLAGGKEQSLNVKGAYLEVWSDMLGSLGVIVGAVVIRFTGWAWVDSLVAVGIGLWVVPRTWQLLRESTQVLLEGVPPGVDFDEVCAAIASAPGVASVHDLHIWAIGSGKISLTAHVVLPSDHAEGDSGAPADPLDVVGAVRDAVARRFDIHHVTVQLERVPCAQAHDDGSRGHRFGPAH